MKTIADVKTRIAKGFESSSSTTREFSSFASAFKRIITAELRRAGAELVSFNRGHFYCSGFYRKGDKFGYFNLPDVRGSFSTSDLMFRSAQHEKDFTGGSNNWVNFTDPSFATRLASVVN